MADEQEDEPQELDWTKWLTSKSISGCDLLPSSGNGITLQTSNSVNNYSQLNNYDYI